MIFYINIVGGTSEHLAKFIETKFAELVQEPDVSNSFSHTAKRFFLPFVSNDLFLIKMSFVCPTMLCNLLRSLRFGLSAFRWRCFLLMSRSFRALIETFHILQKLRFGVWSDV